MSVVALTAVGPVAVCLLLLSVWCPVSGFLFFFPFVCIGDNQDCRNHGCLSSSLMSLCCSLFSSLYLFACLFVYLCSFISISSLFCLYVGPAVWVMAVWLAYWRSPVSVSTSMHINFLIPPQPRHTLLFQTSGFLVNSKDGRIMAVWLAYCRSPVAVSTGVYICLSKPP